jgi:hypothetical protein
MIELQGVCDLEDKPSLARPRITTIEHWTKDRLQELARLYSK